MTPTEPLAALRIGCVQYLNAQPLIHTYTGPVEFDHPSKLARDIANDLLDAALVPVFETFKARRYLLVDDVAIASDGPVYSVFLAYRGELSSVRTVALDPASLTSVHLLQVLLAEYHQLRPECVDARQASGTDGVLLIGNQAMEFRHSLPADMRILDLGEEWKRCTGLPFVYAMWLLRENLPDAQAVADEFRRLKREGCSRIEEIVATEKVCSPETARQYLTEHIRFDLGAREKAGLLKFRELCVKHGFVREPVPPFTFL